MIRYLPVRGTHELEDAHNWARPDSPLAAYLRTHDLENICGSALVPYEWSTALNFANGGHVSWIAGGFSLYYYVVPPLHPEDAWPPAETVVVTHSHGLQPALYAAAYGLKIDRLLDFMGPVLGGSMTPIAAAARRNIRRWWHVRSDVSDWWQPLGELFDGHLGVVRDHPLADRNIPVPKVGHTGLLHDPALFHLWDDLGFMDFVKGVERA